MIAVRVFFILIILIIILLIRRYRFNLKNPGYTKSFDSKFSWLTGINSSNNTTTNGIYLIAFVWMVCFFLLWWQNDWKSEGIPVYYPFEPNVDLNDFLDEYNMFNFILYGVCPWLIIRLWVVPTSSSEQYNQKIRKVDIEQLKDWWSERTNKQKIWIVVGCLFFIGLVSNLGSFESPENISIDDLEKSTNVDDFTDAEEGLDNAVKDNIPSRILKSDFRIENIEKIPDWARKQACLSCMITPCGEFEMMEKECKPILILNQEKPNNEYLYFESNIRSYQLPLSSRKIDGGNALLTYSDDIFEVNIKMYSCSFRKTDQCGEVVILRNGKVVFTDNEITATY